LKETSIPITAQTYNILGQKEDSDNLKFYTLKEYFEDKSQIEIKQQEFEIVQNEGYNIETDCYLAIPSQKGLIVCFILVRENEVAYFNTEVIEQISEQVKIWEMEDNQEDKINQFSIPNFGDFQNLLHDKLHAKLYSMEAMEAHFSLIVNILDRTEGKEKKEELIYAGADKQREILEKAKTGTTKEFDSNWAFLKQNVITEDMLGIKTFTYFNKFRKPDEDGEGKLSIGDLHIDTLKKYFATMDNDF